VRFGRSGSSWREQGPKIIDEVSEEERKRDG
jgi:hypothetical protein